MDDYIIISNLNDFVFCPASIYFHNLYGSTDTLIYQSAYQLNGTKSHESIDNGTYSTRKDVLTAIEVFSEKYHVVGKIDIFDEASGCLIERKRQIKTVYDGYIFQLYAQYFAMCEMGYHVKKLCLYSIKDNKSYPVSLPGKDPEMLQKFENTIRCIQIFSMENFHQDNAEKCRNCIYEPACDRGIT